MIIITGAAGFIGSAFAWKCNRMGIQDLLLVDALKTSEKWRNLVGISYTDFVHKDDFLDMIIDDNMPRNIEAIVHLGACSATTENDGDYLMNNNYRYSQLVFEWCRKRDVRFIYASSAATYGGGEHGFDDQMSSIQPLRPINRYGYSKHLFDRYLERVKGLDRAAGIKFFNVFGPNEYHKGSMKSVICKAYAHILEHGNVQLFKSHRPDFQDGEQARDFVYVKDCIDVLYWMVQHPEVNGLFNLGTGQARTWNDLVKALFNVMNKPEDIQYIDMPKDIQSHYQYFTEANMDKLRAAGYASPFMDLENAVQDYVTHYLSSNRCLDELE